MVCEKCVGERERAQRTASLLYTNKEVKVVVKALSAHSGSSHVSFILFFIHFFLFIVYPGVTQ